MAESEQEMDLAVIVEREVKVICPYVTLLQQRLRHLFVSLACLILLVLLSSMSRFCCLKILR